MHPVDVIVGNATTTEYLQRHAIDMMILAAGMHKDPRWPNAAPTLFKTTHAK